jgi:hypothetical protein
LRNPDGGITFGQTGWEDVTVDLDDFEELMRAAETRRAADLENGPHVSQSYHNRSNHLRNAHPRTWTDTALPRGFELS